MPTVFEHRSVPHTKTTGFTLVDLIVNVAIVVVLTILLTMIVSQAKKPMQGKLAKEQLKSIQLAAERYTMDHHDFPTADASTLNSPRRASEFLFTTLALYLPRYPEILAPSATGEKPALISALGGQYVTGFESKDGRRINWVFVDPGPDKLIGGTMSAENGFVPDSTDANGDGQADHLDNLIEKVSVR